MGFFANPRMLVFYAFALLGLVLLLLRLTGKRLRAPVLLASFVVLGGVIGLIIPSLADPLGMHPSPICSLTKLTPGALFGEAVVLKRLIPITIILGLGLIGRKLFCGWVCPLGALQELAYYLPKIKKLPNLPFRFTNAIRVYLFVVFVIGYIWYDDNIYNYINMFELMHWEIEFAAVVLGLGLLLLVAAVYYRPYCYMICPIGLVSWLLEPLALVGLRVNKSKCNSCQLCVKRAPCPAIGPLINGEKGLLPDCTSCGLCLEHCNRDALSFKLPGRQAPSMDV